MKQPPGFEDASHPSHSHSDPSLFVRYGSNGVVYLLVYEDDIILTGNNSLVVYQVHRDGKGLLLSQAKYVSYLLQDLLMQDSNDVSTVMSSSQSLLQQDGTPSHDAIDIGKSLAVKRLLRYLKSTATYGL
ncbi:hypothetical protein KY290_036761 [Solanum tuberosum]|uniref:Reverse transcriptase Ty1/copia-type domain-containing protein n=1 Tax=Solanum tuberosum TaxID=4113 RepID=A0ABQ7TTN2_SOLTU|nr:hypothetical protein KY290_036761 [Solanum tuberosum]